MNRFFFETAYKGTNYSGWQRQKTAPSVQQRIEDTLTQVLKIKTIIHGCGRTDAGVHAKQYFFHLDLEKEVDIADLLFKINKTLPNDILIKRIIPVSPKANAQKDAIWRTYQYYVHTTANPFLNDISYHETEALDLEKIKQGLKLIEGKHDFRNFSKSPDKMDNCICIIEKARIILNENEDGFICQFKGNRFLHHMIRLIMGNLLKMGKGYLSIDEFKAYIDLEKEPKYFEIASAQGLYLTEVEYPYL